MMKAFRAALAAVAIAMAGAAGGEVRNADAEGFAVGGTIDISASPGQVWKALGQPRRWWDKAHTYTGNVGNLSLNLVPGGCFCEAYARNSGGIEHLRVVHAAPDRLIVLKGELGPLQTGAGSGTLVIALAGQGGNTSLSWTYEVSGLRGGKGMQLAVPVDQVMSAQIARLADFAAGRGRSAPHR